MEPRLGYRVQSYRSLIGLRCKLGLLLRFKVALLLFHKEQDLSCIKSPIVGIWLHFFFLTLLFFCFTLSFILCFFCMVVICLSCSFASCFLAFFFVYHFLHCLLRYYKWFFMMMFMVQLEVMFDDACGIFINGAICGTLHHVAHGVQSMVFFNGTTCQGASSDIDTIRWCW